MLHLLRRLTRLLYNNGIEIEDLWKDSALGCSKPNKLKKGYSYCLLKSVKDVLAEIEKSSNK